MVLQLGQCATLLCCEQPYHLLSMQHVSQISSAAPPQSQSCGAACCRQGQNLVAHLHKSGCLVQWQLEARPHMTLQILPPSSAHIHSEMPQTPMQSNPDGCCTDYSTAKLEQIQKQTSEQGKEIQTSSVQKQQGHVTVEQDLTSCTFATDVYLEPAPSA